MNQTLKIFLAKVLPRRIRIPYQLYKRNFLLKIMPNNSVCAEIGVYKGDFTKRILQVVKPKRLYLIDKWGGQPGAAESIETWEKRYQFVRKKFSSEIKKGKVIIKRDYSHVVLKEFDDSYFDWIYIDGSHQYDVVKQDLELSYLKVKPGGFITGDDYGVNHKPWGPGLKRAVDEFASTHSIKKLQIKQNQFIIKSEKN